MVLKGGALAVVICWGERVVVEVFFGLIKSAGVGIIGQGKKRKEKIYGRKHK